MKLMCKMKLLEGMQMHSFNKSSLESLAPSKLFFEH